MPEDLLPARPQISGKIRRVNLTRVFRSEQYVRALESWSFVDLDGKAPAFTSLFGDVFFQARDGFWWLDTVEGKLSRPWGDAAEVRAALNTPEGQDQYLLGGLAFAAHEAGVVLADDQVYVFDKPPILGGTSTSRTSAPWTSSLR